ncbi:MAG TPA: FAD-binding protein [Clostridiales bacterium]|nr:FAD-binding protein [Clostridiales bacterium]
MYDVIIVGLGPAGATLARLLDKKYSVAVIDKKGSGEEGFRKPCGGLLAMDAQKALSRFGLTLPKEVLVDPQIFAVRTIDLDAGATQHYQRFYINLDRQKFDLWLKTLIPNHVEIFGNCLCTGIRKQGEYYDVEFMQGDHRRVISGKYLVGADGANSIMRRYLYPDKKIRSYVSIQQWFKERNLTPFYSCIFDSKNTDCYSWTISKDGYFIFGGAYPKHGCRERFENQKERLGKLGIHFGEALRTESCLVLRPSRLDDFCTGEDNIFLIGEAAGFISPSSLEGISSAINTGYYLSKVLNAKSSDPCKAYRRKTFRLRLKLYLKVLKSPFMYFPPLRRLVMASGVNSLKMIRSN